MSYVRVIRYPDVQYTDLTCSHPVDKSTIIFLSNLQVTHIALFAGNIFKEFVKNFGLQLNVFIPIGNGIKALLLQRNFDWSGNWSGEVGMPQQLAARMVSQGARSLGGVGFAGVVTSYLGRAWWDLELHGVPAWVHV